MERDENIEDSIKNIEVHKSEEEYDKPIKIRKYFWLMLFPSKIERWLEEMESEGYRLFRIALRGNIFYFTKNEKRKVRYFIDYPEVIHRSYFKRYITHKWKMRYNMWTPGNRMVIWMKPCIDNYDFCAIDFVKDKKALIKKVFKRILQNVIVVIIAIYLFVHLISEVQIDSYTVNLFYICLITSIVVVIIDRLFKLTQLSSYLFKIEKISKISMK
ncbi:DUF2812 domain-containing protein [Clostridium sp. YIM B02505]|uniref:DUF2812 domain-containing protein n=1 Tax=Clostridium yunnanense TaxID=2800325 RepID=A0ABS1EV91_9CLOT|nr:DUF2812 domain-containing protein [Clostridium yunnanense]MBK1813300.1 DUF2812 domain-containing protein [Clostridium yunnanense]